MRPIGILIGLVAFLPFNLSAGEKSPPPDYKEFSKLIHSVLVRQLPKEFEDASRWGQTIPAPDKLPLSGLRTFIKVGNKLEVPHGTWRRFKGKIEHPDKNLKIVVKEFKSLNSKTHRTAVDVDVTFMTLAELQHWQKGLMLFGGQAIVDVRITAAIVCDVGVDVDLKKFPPELKLEPKVTSLGLDFVDFTARDGPFIQGEFGDNLRSDLKQLLRGVVKASEPLVKDEVNRAIVQSLKEGKGTISAQSLMKALPK